MHQPELMDLLNAFVRLACVVTLIGVAALLALRAYDIRNGDAMQLPPELKFQVALGWSLAAIALAWRYAYWWLSWAHQIQGGDGAAFRAYAWITFPADFLLLVACALAAAPYARRISTHWRTLRYILPVTILLGAYATVVTIAWL